MKNTTTLPKLEKGIPVPTSLPHVKYPWRIMNVGDSFFVPGQTTRVMSVGAGLAARRIGGGVKFVTRTEAKGTRVWRIA